MLTEKQVDAVVGWMRTIAFRGQGHLPPLTDMPPHIVNEWRQGVKAAVNAHNKYPY